MRSGADEAEAEQSLLKPSKKMEKYVKVFLNNTEFFTTYNPDMVEEGLLKYLNQMQVDPNVNKNKYKVKFTLKTSL